MGDIWKQRRITCTFEFCPQGYQKMGAKDGKAWIEGSDVRIFFLSKNQEDSTKRPNLDKLTPSFRRLVGTQSITR